jgi:carotenoid cleavage dioxygenase
VLDPHGQLSHFTDIELPGARLPHSLAITEHYTILMDLPLFWDPDLLRNDARKVTFYPELPSRFGVLGRHAKGSTIRWFEAEPCYIYHVVNAWEDGDWVIMDGCRLEHPEPGQDRRRQFAGPYANLLAWMRLDATYHRWQFNMVTGECREEAINDLISEFPMINGRYLGRPSRYSYHVSFAPEDTVLFDGLVRYDSQGGPLQQYKYPAGHYGSEAPFAPRIGSTAEDDGYVLSFVSVPDENRAELQVFDGSDIAAGPICHALIPQHIPSGFHACWVPGTTP